MMRMYVNGVLASSTAYTTTINASSATLYVGADPNDSPFVGTIDNVRIFVRALTAGEIKVMMNTPVAP